MIALASPWKIITGLARDYGARIEVVSIDVPLDVALWRNREREAQVPEAVMENLARKREPVMPDEAHFLLSCEASGLLRPIFGAERENRAAALEF